MMHCLYDGNAVVIHGPSVPAGVAGLLQHSALWMLRVSSCPKLKDSIIFFKERKKERVQHYGELRAIQTLVFAITGHLRLGKLCSLCSSLQCRVV